MNIRLPFLFTFAFLSVFYFPASAQKLMYENFDGQDGITNPFINTIDKGINGYLFVGTGEGLYRYDGFNFELFGQVDGLSEDVVECSFQDADGNLWFGHKNGGVTVYNGESFKVLPLGPYSKSKISGFTQDDQGNVWIATQTDGILRVDSQDRIWQFTKGFEDFILHSISILKSKKCVVGTDMGAIWFDLPTIKDVQPELNFIDEIPLTNVVCLEPVPGKDEIVAGAEEKGLFLIGSNPEGSVKVRELFPKLGLERMQYYDLAFSKSGDLWLGTKGNSLWQMQLDDHTSYNGRLLNYNVNNTLGARNIKKVFPDEEGNTWIGSFGQGLFKLEQSYITLYNFDGESPEKGIFSIMRNGDHFWFGGRGSLYKTSNNPGDIESDFDVEDGLPLDRITSMVMDSEDNLWVGTRSTGIFKLENGDSTFTSVLLSRDQLSNFIYDMAIGDDRIFIATGGGLYVLRDGKILQHYTVRDGLPHNTIKAVVYYDGVVWLAAKGSMLSKLKNGELSGVAVPSSDRMMEVSNISVTSKGELLLATSGNGVFKLYQEKWEQITKNEGLYSNYCYSIEEDPKGRVWVGHNGGMSRMEPDGNWAFFKGTEGIDCTFNPGAIYSGQSMNMWFGTDLGLLFYNESRDRKNTVEPALNITSIEISDSLYNITENIDLPYGAYRLKVDFKGLSYKEPDEVSYSYILEGHDLSWSSRSTTRSAVYNRLDPGTYTFKVKTFNNDGFGGEAIEDFTLFIDKPFWLKWWFFLGVVLLATVIVRYIVVRRLRFLKANQEYLQKELQQRSKEVLDQKELLEQKNKDITDSIIYAKHIQTAMMPSDNDLYECFPESFLLFRPRDIVSGDFYWVNQFEEKIVIACADCTGHGVPGAFMSLISTSLLKEVSYVKDNDSPKKTMKILQTEMQKTLGQNQEQTLRDGMDISIVEIDRKTLQLRASSARRPIVIYQNGERTILPGDRISIGDQVQDPNFEFTEYEVDMNEGDSFYMFSDGMQDQFGGKRGKKLKKKGLLEILDEASSKTMLEQNEFINHKFTEWKKGYDQVDDVILLGVRL